MTTPTHFRPDQNPLSFIGNIPNYVNAEKVQEHIQIIRDENAPLIARVHAAMRLGIIGYLSGKVTSQIPLLDNAIMKWSVACLVTEQALKATDNLSNTSLKILSSGIGLYTMLNSNSKSSISLAQGVFAGGISYLLSTPTSLLSTQISSLNIEEMGKKIQTQVQGGDSQVSSQK